MDSSLPALANCEGISNSRRVFSQDTLSNYRTRTPLLLVVLGDVFDVSNGARFYAAGEGYHTFIGRDNSRAFVTGKFDTVDDAVLDLSVEDLKSIVGWLEFYRNHKEYNWVGVLHGRYFDCNGKATAERLSVFDKIKEAGLPAQSADELLLGRQQFCQITSRNEVSIMSCHKGRSPRLLRYASGRAGGCVCADATALEDFKASPSMSLDMYPGCSSAQSCELPFSDMPV